MARESVWDFYTNKEKVEIIRKNLVRRIYKIKINQESRIYNDCMYEIPLPFLHDELIPILTFRVSDTIDEDSFQGLLERSMAYQGGNYNQWYLMTNCFKYKQDEKWGCFTFDGKEFDYKVPCVYDDVTLRICFGITLYIVKKENKFGIYEEEQGMEIYPCIYDKITLNRNRDITTMRTTGGGYLIFSLLKDGVAQQVKIEYNNVSNC